jgi:hypothetical protein
MPIVKSKMSTSAWVLIALIIVVIIALPILHFVEVIDLSFLGAGFEEVMLWGAENTLNGVLLLGGVFTFGMLTWYTLKKYIFGTQIPTTTVGTYNPIGQQISTQPPQQEETVVSD